MPYLAGSALHIKSGHLKSLPFCVVKIASVFPMNPRLTPPTPSLNGLIIALETQHGAPIAIIEEQGWITQIRTGAAGAIAASLLAKPNASVLGVIGSGAQARLQVEGIIEQVHSIRSLVVWGRTPSNVVRYISDIGSRFPDLKIRIAKSAEEVARVADVLVTATYATEPLICGKSLNSGILVVAMGADSPHKRELDDDALASADLVVVDSRSQNLKLAEIGHGIKSGAFSSDRIDDEIGSLLIAQEGGARPRRQDTDRVICKLTGVAVQEIMVCDQLLRDMKIHL